MDTSLQQNRYARDVWVPRFARRLRELRQSLRAPNATEIAVTEYYLFPDVEPEQAAQSFADETPATEPGRWF